MRYRVIALLMCAIIGGCKSHDQPADEVHFAEDQYADSLKKSGAVIHKVHTVTIEQMKFQPDIVTVNKGDTVLFVNHDMVTHDITEELAKEWRSNPLPADATWKLAPSKSASYYCTIHPVMKGKIVVQ